MRIYIRMTQEFTHLMPHYRFNELKTVYKYTFTYIDTHTQIVYMINMLFEKVYYCNDDDDDDYAKEAC